MEKINKWIDGEVITLDRDPKYQEVINLWPKENEYKSPIRNISKEITLESIQHVHLFYSHRNSLVHEFRMPGLLTMDPISHPEEPSYCVLSREIDEKGNEYTSWELMYPLGFYNRIAGKCLQNIGEYLRRNQIDPIVFFTSGSYWIDELNIQSIYSSG
jgi:hypothetical protein